jgi:hypothetical protein
MLCVAEQSYPTRRLYAIFTPLVGLFMASTVAGLAAARIQVADIQALDWTRTCVAARAKSPILGVSEAPAWLACRSRTNRSTSLHSTTTTTSTTTNNNAQSCFPPASECGPTGSRVGLGSARQCTWRPRPKPVAEHCPTLSNQRPPSSLCFMPSVSSPCLEGGYIYHALVQHRILLLIITALRFFLSSLILHTQGCAGDKVIRYLCLLVSIPSHIDLRFYNR